MADSNTPVNKKRGHNDAQSTRRNKKSKSNYLAKAHSTNSTPNGETVQTGFRAGLSGIFITCERKKEARCVSEMNGILDRYATKMYGISEDGDVEEGENEDEDGDLETLLDKGMEQLANAKNSKQDRPFYSVKIDCQCLTFFAVKPPLVATDIVANICSDAAAPDSDLNFRFAQRLTPITLTGKATLDGLEELGKQVLPPVFHVDGASPLKFAIQATIRNSNNLTRDEIFRTVAGCVGREKGHKVELKDFDVLILVVVYKNIVGMSVVKDFNKLAKFNVSQIQEMRINGGKKPEKAEEKKPEQNKIEEKKVEDVKENAQPEVKCTAKEGEEDEVVGEEKKENVTAEVKNEEGSVAISA